MRDLKLLARHQPEQFEISFGAVRLTGRSISPGYIVDCVMMGASQILQLRDGATSIHLKDSDDDKETGK